MEFREFLENQEKNESLMGIAKAGWNLAAGGAKALDGLAGMGDEAISKFVGDGTKGRMGREMSRFTGGLRQAFSGGGTKPQSKTEPKPDKPKSSSKWFYTSGTDGPHGPITSQQLMNLARSGRLSKEDFVWKDGMRHWTKAGTSPKLFPPPTTKPKEPEPNPALEPRQNSKNEDDWDRLAMRLRTEPHKRKEIMMKMGMLDRDRLDNLVRNSSKSKQSPF